MAGGVVRCEGKMSVSSPNGVIGPRDLLFNLGIGRWDGPIQIPLAAGVIGQAVLIIGATGIVTVNAVLIWSDTTITVSYNGGTAFQLMANGFHLLGGTSITAMALSGHATQAANVEYFLGGAA